MLTTKALAQLDSETFEIQFLSCGELFPNFCTVKESRRRDFQKQGFATSQDCKDCKFSAKLSGVFLSRRGVSSSQTDFLNRYATTEMRDRASEIKSELHLSETSLDFELAGVPVVRYALYETLIKFKKLDLNLNESETKYFQILLENCILTVLTGDNYLNTHKEYKAVLIHSPEYGPNNCFAALASQRGIPVYSIRGSSHLAEMDSSVMIWRWDLQPELPPYLRTWPGSRHVQISESDRKRLAAHMKELVSGKSPFVYSTPFNPRTSRRDTDNKLGVTSNGKTVLLSLSSADEIVAAKMIGRGVATSYPGKVFDSQFDWVKATLAWAKSNPHVRVIVRLHPRDLPNKRESVMSEQHLNWMNLLQNVTKNVAINHPEQGLSFREVCSVSDVLVTGWSSTAIEAMLLGKPVVTYDKKLPGFPGDIHLTGDSMQTYFINLEKALSESEPLDHVHSANSWLTHFLLRGSIQLTGGLLSRLRARGPVLVRKIFSGLDRYLPYVWRPLEIWTTFRASKEAHRINSLLLLNAPSLYSEGPVSFNS